jgi:AcrR family transcriptional regulator
MNPHAAPTDRRVQRTRKSVIDAFVQLVRSRPYDSIRIGDVLRDADVGRSTFYAHYRGKDDLLTQAFSILYEALADCLALELRGQDDRGHLVMLLEHFRENRDLFRRMTTGGAAEAFSRSNDAYAAMIAERLGAHCRERGLAPRLPLSHVAASLCASQLALLRQWLLGRDAGAASAPELAQAMRATIRGQVDALLARG